MSKVVRKKRYHSYKPLIYITAIVIAIIAIAIGYIVYTSQSPPETLVSVNQISSDMNKYFTNIIMLTNLGPYVPTTIAIGVDGKPIAIVQGETLDKALWSNLLSSKFNGSITVLAGQKTNINDDRVIAEIESNITEVCRLLNISNPRSIAIIFGLSTCPHCANQKKFFDNNNIRYMFIELDTRSVIKKL